MDSVGFDSTQFRVCAWGNDGPTRNDLPPVARQRYATSLQREIEFERIVIIGDTVHDVNCARAHGCRSLGVCTGGGRPDELRGAGADRVVSDLSATDEIVAWLANGDVR